MSRDFFYNPKGFTLIELLMVISIIGFLSSVVVAGLNSAREKARIAVGKQFSHTIKNTLGDREIVEFAFDDNLVDLSSNNRNGTVSSGNITYGTGMFDQAAVFDGASYITALDPQVFGPTDAITIEVWVNPAVDLPSGCSPNIYQNIVNNYTWWGPWSIILECGMVIKFSASEDYPEGSARRVNESTKTIKAGKWSHIVLSADRNRMRGYIDGRLVTEVTSPVINGIGTTTSSHILLPLDTIYVGRQGTGGWHFKGMIDNLRVYRGVLDEYPN